MLNDMVTGGERSLCDAHGRWTADYVRLRFSARKAAS